MSAKESVEIVLEAFKAVERRDEQRLRELYHRELEFHWPPSLPLRRIESWRGGRDQAGWLERDMGPVAAD